MPYTPPPPPPPPSNYTRESGIKEIAEKIIVQRLRGAFGVIDDLLLNNIVYESIQIATKLYDFKIPEKNET